MTTSMGRIKDAVEELLRIFQTSATKYEANERAAVYMGQLTNEPAFLTAVLEQYVLQPRTFNRGNYPVVGIELALNPWFGLVANCWIPHPDRATHVATKMIHHHGDMLLTTATLFGPGYEHWMFTLPRAVDERVFTMDLLEAGPHAKGHVSFVDAWTAHTPLFPKSLSITLALWSRRFPTTWRDRAKRLPVVRDNVGRLTKLGRSLGLRRALQLNVIESFDYYPEGDRFVVMRERKEFALGPNADHVQSVFHLLQETGNEHLGRIVKRQLDRGVIVEGRRPVERFLSDLEAGRPIEGKLSPGHYDLSFANYTRDDILRALGQPDTKAASHGVELSPTPARQTRTRPSAA